MTHYEKKEVPHNLMCKLFTERLCNYNTNPYKLQVLLIGLVGSMDIFCHLGLSTLSLRCDLSCALSLSQSVSLSHGLSVRMHVSLRFSL